MGQTVELGDLIEPDRVIISLRLTDKGQLIRELSHRASKALGIADTFILDALCAREGLGSTGIGQGIAMSHARIEGLKQSSACSFAWSGRSILQQSMGSLRTSCFFC